jgi:hypothetical protein
MKLNLFKTSVFTMIFALLFSNVSIASTLATTNEDDEKLVEEVAAQLEFLWEEATIKDDDGNIVDIDFDLLEENFGTSEELSQLKELYTASPVVFTKPEEKLYAVDKSIGALAATMNNEKNDAHNRCVNSKMGDFFNETFLGISALALIYEYLWSGEYTLAAKKLIKMGVKSNIFVVVAQLTWIVGTCAVEVDNGEW